MKRYTIEIEEDENGKSCVTRRAENFSAIELLGILEHTQMEIVKQMAGEIRPDKITREVVITDAEFDAEHPPEPPESV